MGIPEKGCALCTKAWSAYPKCEGTTTTTTTELCATIISMDEGAPVFMESSWLSPTDIPELCATGSVGRPTALQRSSWRGGSASTSVAVVLQDLRWWVKIEHSWSQPSESRPTGDESGAALGESHRTATKLRFVSVFRAGTVPSCRSSRGFMGDQRRDLGGRRWDAPRF